MSEVAEVMSTGEVDAEAAALFDTAPYAIPKLDGHVADKITLAFGGSVELDRLVEDDLALVEGLRLGQDVTFTVQCTVAAKGFTHTAKADDEEQVGYTAKLRVHSVDTG